MPTNNQFQKAYQGLNLAQREAVDSIEGPVMVIAGPGTGKTQILTLRIANILKQTDTEPDSILALTFTKSGVLSMRKRLVGMIGATGYRVNINTFHGFCNEIIKNYPEEFPRIIGGENATKIDQIKIMEQVISDTKLKILRPYGDRFYYLDPSLSEINRLKRENISPKDFAKIVKELELTSDDEKNVAKNKELLKIYKKYEELLREQKLYDYGDMIMEVITTLEKNKDLLRQLQEQYQYVLADEHQDANQSQNKILELLSNFHDSPNLFIVGDDKQAIFQFQGASLDNFSYFHGLYPEAKIIKLEENYRSTQVILDSAFSLIGNSKEISESIKVELRSQKKEGANIVLRRFSRQELEFKFLAEDIKNKQKAGVELSDIAVLYRDNSDAFPTVRALEQAEVPFALLSDENILGDDEVRKLITILKAVYYFGAEEHFLKLLHVDFLKIDSLSIYKLVAQARELKVGVFDIIDSGKHKKLLDTKHAKLITKLYLDLSRWNKDSKIKNATTLFEEVINESGLVDYLLSQTQTVGKVEKLRAVFDEIKEYTFAKHNYTLGDFIEYLEVVERYHLPLNHTSEKGLLGVDGVRLMTAHRSKGLEFEYVYIVGAYDGHFGNKRGRKHFNIPMRGLNVINQTNEDERRLFYVALTRAKKEVVISYPKLKEGGGENLPAQFIEEIDKKFIAEEDVSAWEEEAEKPTKETFKKTKKLDVSLGNKEFLNKLFLHQGLSVTALNNYLRCPWEYFFNNLVRVPQAQNKHMLYGTAVHNALKDFFDAYGAGEKVTKKALLELFKKYLEAEPFDEIDYEESLAKGERALGGWFDTYKNTWNAKIINEFGIRGIPLPIKIGNGEVVNIVVNGKLDKIEQISDTRVNVVDYKTGKPKSRNDIEGKTKTSDGDYKRQLVFYKLLLDNYANGKYQMETGTIDFIEPNDRGKYKKEVFEITSGDVRELRELIERVVDEIINLSFWDKKCDNKACESCRLRRLMG